MIKEQAEEAFAKQDYAKALELFRQYTIECGDDFVVHAKMASCLVAENDYEEAKNHITWAIANAPGNGESHFIFGAVLGGMYDPYGALRESEVALSLQPEHPSAMWNKALYSFQVGDYKTAFRYYSFGQLSNARPVRNRFPKGTPKDWEGKTLHIWCEQGHGDIFMLSRYIRLVKDLYRPAKIIFETYPETIPIFFNHPSCDVIYKRPTNHYMPYAAIDYSVSLWDIPILISEHCEGSIVHPKNVRTIKQDVNIDQSLYDSVAEYFPSIADGKFKVGLCWKGNPSHVNDCNRSSTVEEFVKPLLDVEGVQYFSLQYDEEIDNVTNLGKELANWAITGAYLTQLDLLITADTAIAHLAGVLGVPTFVVCPFANEWRWGYHPDEQGWSCDWYGTHVRIFRQTVRKDWSSVMPVVIGELKKLLSWHKTTPLGQPIQTLSNSLE